MKIFLHNLFYTSKAQERDWALLSSFTADLSPAKFIESLGAVNKEVFFALERLDKGMDRESRERIDKQSVELFEELTALARDDLKKLNELSRRVNADDEQALRQIESVIASYLRRRVSDRNDWAFVAKKSMLLFHYVSNEPKEDWSFYAVIGMAIVIGLLSLLFGGR